LRIATPPRAGLRQSALRTAQKSLKTGEMPRTRPQKPAQEKILIKTPPRNNAAALLILYY
jgi:hypothetical protein